MIAFHITRKPVTGSTNDDARQAAEQNAAEGEVVWALRQTAGRGRRGRSWSSPAGNLYASLLVRPGCRVEQAGQISFVMALAIHDVLAKELGNTRVRLKWPNDVLVDDRKLAGILLECSDVTDDKIAWLIIGFGINVKVTPERSSQPAICLSETGLKGPLLELEGLLEAVLERFGHWYELWQKQGFAPVRQAWLTCAKGLGGRITVRLPDRELEGNFDDLDASGALRLGLPNGETRMIAAGDVFFRVSG